MRFKLISFLFFVLLSKNLYSQAAGLPDILYIDPSTVYQNQSYNLYLSTVNFDPSRMSVSFGDGISLNSLTCSNPYSCNANISVSQNASVGTRDIIIYYVDRPITATAKITVAQSQNPDILSINPSMVFQGQNYDLTLNTINFDPKSMYLDFGTGIILNSLSCSSRTYCTASVTVSPDAQTGIRDVKIIYGNQSIIATAKISVEKEQAPDVLSVNPSNLNQGKIYDLSLQVTNFDPYKMSLNFGSGTTINSLTCPSKYSCISNLSVSNNAEPGIRDIKIQYRDKTYIATAKITIIPEQPPDILSVNPSVLEKDKNYSLNLNTINFDSKTMTLDFGSGITINNINCTSPNICTSNIFVSTNTQSGIRDIKIKYRDKTYIATAKITIEEEKMPDILSANPSNLYQGESYSLVLNTINFDQKKMVLNFGEGISGRNLNCPSTSICNLNLDVSGNAKTGIRDIKIIYKEKEIIATAKLNIQEEQMPDVLSANPSNLIQGESYNLNLNTLRYDQRKMAIDFGEEIKLNSLSCQSSSFCNANVFVLQNAKAGVKDINILYKDKKIVSTAKIIISESLEPDIITANPSFLSKGKEYSISLNTVNFDVKTMQIDIGSGFEIKKFNCINKFNCFLDLKVLSEAKTGERDIFIFYKNKRKMATAKLNIEKEKEIPTTTPTAVIVPEFKCEEKDYSNIQKSKIDLLEPKIYSANDYAVIKEGSLFKWSEKNLGLAEWFEFRIIWNGKIIWRKKIESFKFKSGSSYLPNFFVVNSEFLNEMAKTDWKAITSSPQGGMVLNNIYGVILQWQVAGFRNYPKTCIAVDLGPKVEMEVEISDKWNFAFPDMPTGLSCSKAKNASGIQIQNLDIGKGMEYGEAGTQNYPQDRIEISGYFSLQNAPYSVDQTIAYWSGGQTYTTTIYNIIVDWGDGSINFLPVDFKLYGMSTKEALNKGILNIKPIIHQYNNVGKRKIRIFMLSDKDLQNINPAIIASSYDNYNSNPYWQIVSTYNNFSQDASILELAEKAYLIYCHEIEISPIEDVIANGILHLESVNISSYNGEKIKPGLVAIVPNFSSCQVLQADANLKYYGKGNAYEKWSLIAEGKELPVGGEWLNVGPSKARENLTRDNFNKVTEESYDFKPLSSPLIDLKNLENKTFGIKVEVNVGIEEALALNQEKYLNAYFNNGFKNEIVYYASLGGEYYIEEKNTSSSQNPYTNTAAYFGVLSPSQEATGLPTFANLENTDVGGIVNFNIPKEKPYYVKDVDTLKVMPSASNYPCKFLFRTKSGDAFEIYVEGQVNFSNGKYNGEGNLLIKLYEGQGLYFEKILKIKIQNWKVDEEGNVLEGEINEVLSDQIESLGMKIKFEKINAKANETDMELTLSVKAQDTTIRITGKTDVPEWKNIKSILSSDGNWFWEGNWTQEISIGASGFRLKINSIKIDLSAKEGDGIGNFCSNDNSFLWAGINFGNVVVLPYTFDLNNEKNLPYEKTSNNWGIVSDGLCGKVEFPSFYAKIKKGSISFEKLEVESKNGNFKAIYKNMDVEVPWLDIHMKGNAKYVPSEGSSFSHIDLTGLASNKTSVSKSYNNISFKAENFKFGFLPNIGWATKADLFFDFKRKGVYFAKNVPVPAIYFDMDYRAYFEEGIQEKTIQVNQSSHLGKSPVFVKSMKIKNNKTGNELFNFSFITSFSISTKIPTVDSTVDYSFLKESQTFKSTGPKIAPFEVLVKFPEGKPNVEAKIKVSYDESLSTANLESYENYLAYNGNLETLLFSPDSPEDYFKGEVDLSMIGAPVKGEFRLGYWKGNDYFLIRSTVDLGSGIALAPPLPLNLYKIRGGLGHNFPLDAFQSTQSIFNLQPKMDGSYLFMAGVRIGTTDKYTFVADGDLTIKLNEGARMDFHAWILKNSQTGEGDFQGFLQYSGGSIDGSLWSNGNYYLVDGADVYFNIPKGSTTFHFSSLSDWFITAGKKDGGWDNLSNKLKGHIIFVDGYGYWMLGVPVGYHLGAYIGANLTVGDCGSACIYGNAYIGGEYGISLSPMRISGSAKAGASIGGCLKAKIFGKKVGGCKDFGVNLTCNLETPNPTKVNVTFSLDPPIPCVDGVDIIIGIVPPSFDWDVEWCI